MPAPDIARPVIRIAPNPPVFDLPLLVGLEAGLFAAEGLDVVFAAKYEDHDREARDVLSRQKEALFEEGKADGFNVCEWGGIDRIERGAGRGRIGALRPAVAAQAILALDPALQVPRDLAGVPVGVNEFTGSHYTTVQLLESALGRDGVKLEHIGAPEVRLDALFEGRLRAVTVMEPFISLGLKRGAHIVALTFYRGAEVLSPDIAPGVRAGYFRALNKAVDLIRADFRKYAHHVAKAAGGALAPEELDDRFVRYVHAETYQPPTFDLAYDFMKDRGLSEGRKAHADLVLAQPA